jgi:short-subunit dehydrogenase
MGRLAMVTGASSGIGEAYATRLAADGWNLVLVARRVERLEEIASRLEGEHGVSAQALPADLGNVNRLGEVCAEASQLPLELVVNNAALAHYMPFATLPPESAQELVELNVLAPVLLTRAVLPGMISRGTGAVVNVASLLAFSGSWEAPFLPQRAVYAASKSFLLTFTEILATELRGTGVRVQVVCPGVVRSEFHTRQGLDMSAMPRMEPGSVAEASLLDLERGVVISIPGADDTSAVEHVQAAGRELMGITRATELPGRYRDSPAA